jgi:hypothetical protein
MVGGSAGRATGRPAPKELAGLGAGATATRAAGLLAAFTEDLVLAVRFTAERVPSLRPARLRVLLGRLVRLVVDRADLAFVRLVPPRLPSVRAARFVVIRFPVDADFFVDRLAVVAFFLVEDFFFAGIFPPFGCATQTRAWFMRMRTR